MGKMHLIMPMAGGGTRFGNRGFNAPKPLIELGGKPLFFWAVQSVAKFMPVEDIIFVVLREHIDNFLIDKKILSFYPDAVIKEIPGVLNGAVLTCLEGIKEINDDLPLLFNDCDHAFICNELYSFADKGDFSEPDGALMTFNSDNPAYSYAQFDEYGILKKTVEKQVISDKAICGAYYFKNKDLFLRGSEDYLNNCNYKEFFMSGIYNSLAENNVIKSFRTDKHISFGTPKEYDEVCKNLGCLKDFL